MKVLYVGHYKDGNSSGWANASKDTILAMDAAGIDLVTRALKLNEVEYSLPDRIIELEDKSSLGCDICIQNVLPHHLDYNGRFKKNIACCVYEMYNSRLSSWSAKINTMDELWCPSMYSKECFKTMGVTVPIKVVPHTFDMSKYKPQKKIDHIELDGDFVFYTIGDLNKRKDFLSLIKAFHLEFSPNEPVKLLIKTSKHGLSGQECAKVVIDQCAQVKKEMKLYRRLEDYSSEIIVGDTLDDEGLMRIHSTGDCFVTTSHGEGWCIPLFDSIAMGKPAIYPSHPVDSMFDFVTNVFSVGSKVEPVFGMSDTFFELSSSRESWVTVDIDELRHRMRSVYVRSTSNDPWLIEKIRESKEKVDNYSYDKVGKLIKETLNDA